MEASGFASGLYWVIRIVLLIFGGRGRGWAGRVAPVFGRLNLRIEPQVEKRFGGENPPYDLVRVLVSNNAGSDALDVRADFQWKRVGHALPERGPTHGGWVETKASDMASFSGPPLEELTLSSNGAPGCLPVVVKYPGQRDAYIATRSTYIAGVQPRWTNAAFVLQPGSYDAVVTFRSRGNKTGQVTLRVTNEGDTGTVRLDLAPLSTIKP